MSTFGDREFMFDYDQALHRGPDYFRKGVFPRQWSWIEIGFVVAGTLVGAAAAGLLVGSLIERRSARL